MRCLDFGVIRDAVGAGSAAKAVAHADYIGVFKAQELVPSVTASVIAHVFLKHRGNKKERFSSPPVP
ncbi:MAG: hypothetical protein JWQ71_4259 [Pedosphaera sp.]|nr:hypothetical protein [Pedosphaera sp.]